MNRPLPFRPFYVLAGLSIFFWLLIILLVLPAPDQDRKRIVERLMITATAHAVEREVTRAVNVAHQDVENAAKALPNATIIPVPQHSITSNVVLSGARPYQTLLFLPTSKATQAISNPPHIVVFINSDCIVCDAFISDLLPHITRVITTPFYLTLRFYTTPADRFFMRALALECAGKLRGAQAFYDLAYGFASGTAPRMLEKHTISPSEMQACLESPETLAGIYADYRIARDVKVPGTPQFYINGYPINPPSFHPEHFNAYVLRSLELIQSQTKTGEP